MNNFKKMHSVNNCLVIGNAWDILSAIIMEQSGFQAIGTTSWGVANSFGLSDGEYISFNLYLNLIKKIISKVNIPVSADIESGFGISNNEITENVLQLAEIGCAGINIEDSTPAGKLKDSKKCAETINTIKSALKEKGYDNFFVNFRTDTYILTQDPLEETIKRAKLYEENGADGIFVPLLTDHNDIKQVLKTITVPLNIMSVPGLTDIEAIKSLGVRRFSFGNAMSDAVISYIEAMSSSILTKNSTNCLFNHKDITTTFLSNG